MESERSACAASAKLLTPTATRQNPCKSLTPIRSRSDSTILISCSVARRFEEEQPRKASRQDGKVAGLELEHDCPGDSRILSRGIPHYPSKLPDQTVCLRKTHIASQRVLCRDRLRRPVGKDRAVIDATCQLAKSATISAELS
jgi:hypothetical protein